MSATLQGERREKLGSRTARKLRASGRIPVSIQGEDKEHVHASIDAHEFMLARRHHEHLFDIEFGGSEPETAVVRELQYDAFGDHVVHIDFRRVVRGVAIDSEVELAYTGHPKGGILNHLVTHVTIRCLPSEIPDAIEVSVEGLEPGHPLHASDLVLPEGMELGCAPELQIAVIVAPRGIEEPEAPEEEAAAPTEEPSAEGAPPTEGGED